MNPRCNRTIRSVTAKGDASPCPRPAKLSRSRPAQKARPSPRSSTARTEVSASTASAASASWSNTSDETALSLSGRSKVTVATPSATSTRTTLSMSAPLPRRPKDTYLRASVVEAIVDHVTGRRLCGADAASVPDRTHRRMDMDRKTQALSEVALFAGCSRRQLDQIARLADEVEVPAGTVLTRQGRPGREAYVVRSGGLDVVSNGRSISSVGPGEMAGEIALLDDGPRTATLVASADSRIFVFDPIAFATVIDHVPSVARALTVTLARRLRESLARTA